MKRFFSIFLAGLMLFSHVFANTYIYSQKTHNVVVCGEASSRLANEYVSVLLENKSDKSIGHIGMCQINENGEYFYKFKFSGDIANYILKTKLQNEDISQSIVEAYSAEDVLEVSAEYKNASGDAFNILNDSELQIAVSVKNLVGDTTPVGIFAAFKDENDTLLDFCTVFTGELSYDDSRKVTSELLAKPDGAKKVEMYAFKDLQSLQPLSGNVKTDCTYGRIFYIAPAKSGGSDSNDGSRTAPFLTLNKAKQAIRTLKSQNGGKLPYGGIKVYLMGGDYTLDSELGLSSSDSGTEEAPITYSAYPGERVRITAGGYISGSNCEKIDSSYLYYDKFDADAKNSIYALDLTSVGITDYTTINNKMDLGIEVFMGDNAFELAKWPNDTPDGFDGYVHNTGLVTDSTDSRTKPVLELDAEDIAHINSWDSISDVYCAGWFGYKFYFDILKLDAVNNNQITLEKGVAGGFSDASNGKQTKKDRFYFMNVPEELDAPGEYYIDRNNGILYMYPFDGFNDSTEIGLSIYKPTNLISLRDGADYINFENISFELTRCHIFDIYKSKNISIKNCTFKNITGDAVNVGRSYALDGQELRWGNVDDTEFSVDTKNVTVSDCTFKNIGKIGINMYGGSFRTLEKANMMVENCTFDNCGRTVKSYAPSIGIGGVGITARGNVIKNQDHQGMTASGNDILIEYNEFDNLLRETSDMGMIYTSYTSLDTEIRYNYFHNVDDGMRESYDKEHLSYNIQEMNIPVRVGVYNDGFRMGYNVHNNVFENIPIGFIGQSYGQSLNDNIFIDVYHPMYMFYNGDVIETVNSGKGILEANSTEILDKIYNDKTVKAVWENNYPEVFKLREKLLNRTNAEAGYLIADVSDNLIAYSRLSDYGYMLSKLDDVNEGIIHKLDMASRGEDFVYDNNILVEDIDNVGFKDYKNKDYSYFAIAPIFKQIPGLSLTVDKVLTGQKLATTAPSADNNESGGTPETMMSFETVDISKPTKVYNGADKTESESQDIFIVKAYADIGDSVNIKMWDALYAQSNGYIMDKTAMMQLNGWKNPSWSNSQNILTLDGIDYLMTVKSANEGGGAADLSGWNCPTYDVSAGRYESVRLLANGRQPSENNEKTIGVILSYEDGTRELKQSEKVHSGLDGSITKKAYWQGLKAAAVYIPTTGELLSGTVIASDKTHHINAHEIPVNSGKNLVGITLLGGSVTAKIAPDNSIVYEDDANDLQSSVNLFALTAVRYTDYNDKIVWLNAQFEKDSVSQTAFEEIVRYLKEIKAAGDNPSEVIANYNKAPFKLNDTTKAIALTDGYIEKNKDVLNVNAVLVNSVVPDDISATAVVAVYDAKSNEMLTAKSEDMAFIYKTGTNISTSFDTSKFGVDEYLVRIFVWKDLADMTSYTILYEE